MAESQAMYIANVMYGWDPICKWCKLKYNEWNVSPVVYKHGKLLGYKYQQERVVVQGGELLISIKPKPISYFSLNYPCHEHSISCSMF